MSDRLNRYGHFNIKCGENISYGSTVGREVVISLIIDDDVPDRGHRTNMFKDEFKIMGSFSGPHSFYKDMTVIDYAGGWRKKGSPDPVKLAMDAIKDEKINFTEPEGWVKWSEASKIQSDA